MSQQSDSADLLGGFKPVNIRALSEPVLDKFRKIFFKTFSRKQNASFVGKVRSQSAHMKVFFLFFSLKRLLVARFSTSYNRHVIFPPFPSSNLLWLVNAGTFFSRGCGMLSSE